MCVVWFSPLPLGLGRQLTADCPSLQQKRDALPPSVLFPNFFSGISSCQLPLDAHPSYLLYSPPSSPLCLWALPNSLARENNCSCMFEETQPAFSDGLFSPTEAQQTDFLLLLKKEKGKKKKNMVMFCKIGSEVSKSWAPKWLWDINIFDMQVEREAISPNRECLKPAETVCESRSD